MYAVGAILGFLLPIVGVVVFGALILFCWLPIPQQGAAGVTVGAR